MLRAAAGSEFFVGNPYGDEVVDRTVIRHNKKAVCDPYDHESL